MIYYRLLHYLYSKLITSNIFMQVLLNAGMKLKKSISNQYNLFHPSLDIC
jgi:hypothetical protein